MEGEGDGTPVDERERRDVSDHQQTEAPILWLALFGLAALASAAWFVVSPSLAPVVPLLLALAGPAFTRRPEQRLLYAVTGVGLLAGLAVGWAWNTLAPAGICDPCQLTVRVADAEARPIASARVVVLTAAGAVTDITDSNGLSSIVVAGASNAEGHLVVEHPDFDVFDSIARLAPSDFVEVRLAPPSGAERDVLIYVVDAVTEQPVAGAEVTLLMDGDAFTDTSDSNGVSKLRLRFDGETVDVDITVRSNGVAANRQRVALYPGQVHDVRLGGQEELSVQPLSNTPSAAQESASGGQHPTLHFDQSHDGHVSVPGTSIWVLEANAGDRMLLRVTPTTPDSQCQIRVRLLDGDANMVESRYGTRTNPAEMIVDFGQTAIHTVVIEGTGSACSEEDFRADVSRLAT